MDALTRSRGFTLVEMLVVLLIMGMFVGLASTIVRPDDRELLRVEAERLAQLLELAVDESSFSGKSIAWTADKSAYRFWRMTGDNEWTEVRDNDLLRARALPQGMTITGLQIENTPAHGNMRLEFTPYSQTLSFTIKMSFGAARHAVTASPIGELQVSQRKRAPRKGGSNGVLAQR